jgi:predicted transcriptional regulator
MKKAKLKDKPPLTSAQREIMEIVWDKGEVAVFEVTEVLNSQRSVARNTIRTLMDRMEDKGWLTHRVIGRTYFYSALVPREESLGQRVLDMIDKACGGRPENLMMALLDYRGLSDEEVDQIQKLLDDAKND